MHLEGGLEVARVTKNMSSLKVLDLNGMLQSIQDTSDSSISSRQLLRSWWGRWNSSSTRAQDLRPSNGIQVIFCLWSIIRSGSPVWCFQRWRRQRGRRRRRRGGRQWRSRERRRRLSRSRRWRRRIFLMFLRYQLKWTTERWSICSVHFIQARRDQWLVPYDRSIWFQFQLLIQLWSTSEQCSNHNSILLSLPWVSFSRSRRTNGHRSITSIIRSNTWRCVNTRSRCNREIVHGFLLEWWTINWSCY